MSCYNPKRMFIYDRDSKTGKCRTSFREKNYVDSGTHKQLGYKIVDVPCGHCLGCSLDYSRNWASRLYLESLTSTSSYFITLTYSDEFVPLSHSVQKRDLQLFIKRLRKLTYDELGFNCNIRYYGCGEYGDHTFRPHYHLIIFNLPGSTLKGDMSDLGYKTYVNHFVQSAWPVGFVEVGEFTYQSASYVARYCLKKQNASKYEKQLLIDSGRSPEFNVMSRRPGIGYDYIKAHESELLKIGGFYVGHEFHTLSRYLINLIESDRPNDIINYKNQSRDCAVAKSTALASTLGLNCAELNSYNESLKKSSVKQLKRRLK